jgi:hypothetical protein
MARVARRATRLIHKQQFAMATNLIGSLGIVDANVDTMKSLHYLFPQPAGVSEEMLLG